MKVNLASQTLSQSIANAVDFMHNVMHDERFEGSEATFIFLTTVDRLFDRLNAWNPYGKYQKSPITAANISDVETDLQTAIRYLSMLKLPNGQLLVESRRRTTVIGFKCAASGIIGIAKHLLLRRALPFDYFLPRKCSQDHVETLFSVIRRRGGWNNNPNVLQVNRNICFRFMFLSYQSGFARLAHNYCRK